MQTLCAQLELSIKASALLIMLLAFLLLRHKVIAPAKTRRGKRYQQPRSPVTLPQELALIHPYRIPLQSVFACFLFCASTLSIACLTIAKALQVHTTARRELRSLLHAHQAPNRSNAAVASTHPFAAARRYHRTASAWSCATTFLRPCSKMVPILS